MPGSYYLLIFEIDKDATETMPGNCKVPVGKHVVRRRLIVRSASVVVPSVLQRFLTPSGDHQGLGSVRCHLPVVICPHSPLLSEPRTSGRLDQSPCLLPTAYCLLPTVAHCLLSTVYCLRPTPTLYCRLLAANFQAA
jgi:hypothetical protein